MKIVLLIFCIVFFKVNLLAQDKPEIIKSISLIADHVEKGVRGINVTVSYNFQFLDSIYPADSILKDAVFASSFKIYLEIFENGKNVSADMGHNSVTKENGHFYMRSGIILMQDEVSKDMKADIFIPYASLKLTPEKHRIKLKAWISGKDGLSKSHKSAAQLKELEFTKPATKIFEVAIDSLVVNYFDTRGQAWDRSLFGSDSPDLDFNVYVASVNVGNIYKEDSYFVSSPSRPWIFRFVISENDEVILSLQDRDNIFHDDIASWKFISSNMRPGISYEQNQAKNNMRSFSFRCKVE